MFMFVFDFHATKKNSNTRSVFIIKYMLCATGRIPLFSNCAPNSLKLSTISSTIFHRRRRRRRRRALLSLIFLFTGARDPHKKTEPKKNKKNEKIVEPLNRMQINYKSPSARYSLSALVFHPIVT